MRLILASASPRRAELLAAAGFHFEAWPVEVDERPQPAEPPADYVLRLAREKSALALSQVLTQSQSAAAAGRHDAGPLVVIGADTSVVVDGAILGKPADAAEGAEMLRALSGRRHEVLTGVSLRWAGVRPPVAEATAAASAGGGGPAGPAETGFVSSTAVFFAELGDEEIAWYVQSREGCDKAGGYAIQGLASRFIRHIEGSYSNVVGLPVAALYERIVRTPSAK